MLAMTNIREIYQRVGSSLKLSVEKLAECLNNATV